MWIESTKERGIDYKADEGPCVANAVLILGSFAPELGEFFAPDAFCMNIKDERACQTVHLTKDLSLESFIIIRESLWPYYTAILTVWLTIFLLLKCCRLPPPPVLPAPPRPAGHTSFASN